MSPLNDELRRFYYEHRLFIFDFDGVILESVDARNNAFFALFDDYGELVCQRVLALHLSSPGIDRRDKIRRCYREILYEEPSIDELDRRIERFGSLAKSRVLTCPKVSGVDRFMQSLESQRCYLVSIARQDEVQEIVVDRDLVSWFVGVYGGPKNKVENISKILEREAVQPQDVVFIGDKISDFTAAQTTGVDFYGRLPELVNNPFPAQVPVFTDFNQLYNFGVEDFSMKHRSEVCDHKEKLSS